MSRNHRKFCAPFFISGRALSSKIHANSIKSRPELPRHDTNFIPRSLFFRVDRDEICVRARQPCHLSFVPCLSSGLVQPLPTFKLPPSHFHEINRQDAQKSERSRDPFICFSICPVQIHPLLHPTDWPKVTRPWREFSPLSDSPSSINWCGARRDKIVIFREAAGEAEGMRRALTWIIGERGGMNEW